MDGSGQYHRPDQGGRSGTAGEGGQGVRDWQRNTWFGPVPQNTNPFDEPETAPELKDSRSENVNEHMGDFWAPHDSGFRPGAGQQETGRTERKKKTGGLRRFAGLAAVIAVLAAVVVVLRLFVFNVTEIQVLGNSQIPAGEIIRLSGIRKGDNILFLNEQDIERRITSDYRLQFRYMERQLPHSVFLSVREREACCWLTYCGIMYVMDKNRMVLYETEDPTVKPADLVEVRGLEVRSDTLVGQIVNLGSETQQTVFSELFLEMKVLGCTNDILEADISNTESILLATRDGYTVSLGNTSNLHAKLRSMKLVHDELRNMGQTGGTINVSNPETPIYAP